MYAFVQMESAHESVVHGSWSSQLTVAETQLVPSQRA
jgi:hypothetical protein